MAKATPLTENVQCILPDKKDADPAEIIAAISDPELLRLIDEQAADAASSIYPSRPKA